MKALLFDGDVRVDLQYPTPVPAPGEALIRVTQAGVCSTDLELCKGYMNYAGILGHEFVGTVEDAAAPSDLKGRRVVGEINAACRACATCAAGRQTHCPHRTVLGIAGRNGAFAEYLTLPVDNLLPLDDEISNDQATFVEPLAAACEILEQRHIRPTDRVVVIGDGRLGILCAQVLSLASSSVTLLGRHSERNDWLAARGIALAHAESHIDAGTDIVVEATGTALGFGIATRLVRPRGTIVLKSTYHGQPAVDMAALVIHEIQVLGSRCGPFAPAIRLLRQGAVDIHPMIHARYPLDEGLRALEHANRRGTLKVILHIDHNTIPQHGA